MVHAVMAAVAAGRGARADDARAAAGRAGRRPARDPGQGARRRRDPRRRLGARRRGAGRAGAADLGALGARARRRQGRGRDDRRAGGRSAARAIRQGDIVVLDADGVAVVEAERVDEVLEASLRARGAASASSARKLQAGELLLRPRRPARYGRRGRLTLSRTPRPRPLAHAELLTPDRRARACASSSTCSAWRSRAARASRSSCAAGATTSATA